MFDLSDSNLIFTGGLILVVAWALRKTFRNQRRIRNRNPLREAQQEISKLEQSQFNRLNQLEIKLYEYGREIEARSDDRLRILDELLLEADQEINRLRQQLALAQQNSNDVPLKSGPDILMYESSGNISVTAEQRSMIVYLSQAGFSAQEISNCFTYNLAEIEVILAEENNPPHTDVA
ncbi:MAG: hypothetical protein QM501_14425 [Gimesia sp.]